MKYFLKCLYNYANCKGRARRKELFYFILYSVILIALWNLAWLGVYHSIGQAAVDQYLQMHPGINALTLIVYPAIYIFLATPFVTVIARRFNDTGISIYDFFIQIWVLIFVLAIIGVLTSHIVSFLGNVNIDQDRAAEAFGILSVIIIYFYFFYYLIKKGTPGDNPFGPDPRIDDPIENARKISRMDDDNSESHSSDNDSDPFAPKQ